MSKQFKFLLILLAVAVSAVLYLIIISKPVNNIGKQINGEPGKIVKVDLERLENDYKNSAKEIFNNYSALIQNNDFSDGRLKSIKNQLLDLKVPTKFKDLHIDFVLAIVKMENYLENGVAAEKDASQELINKIKADYAWLN